MICFGSLGRGYSLSKGSPRLRTISASMYNVIAIPGKFFANKFSINAQKYQKDTQRSNK